MAITEIDCPSTYTYYPTFPFTRGQGSTPSQATSDAAAQFIAQAVAFAKWIAGLKDAAPKCAGGADEAICAQSVTGPTIVFSFTNGDSGTTAQPNIRYWAQLTATATMSVTCGVQGATMPPKAQWF
ncbi:MAG: hypothetical protein ABR924_03650 [Terracidiphilus sp.]|jgi:hypothetical protein